ncbi:hypothetical protein FA95DRAFT_1552348 [Auriscalpium vulgare]|uniref:Uncharacterized protein n=1 Tax=Auriscalpium vulgare TaxID=40419 RepID=A0ACB8SAS5_9AGAM|nr:hypothetical protein FA95DRAFT_1552348 [Auriscalpium vulgare]
MVPFIHPDPRPASITHISCDPASTALTRKGCISDPITGTRQPGALGVPSSSQMGPRAAMSPASARFCYIRVRGIDAGPCAERGSLCALGDVCVSSDACARRVSPREYVRPDI